MGKAKAHTRYKTSDGQIVPGVTTITNMMAKPMLIKWANNLGLQGIDSSKYVDELADVGTCTHLQIESYLKGVSPDMSDFSENCQKTASNSVSKFFNWEKENDFKCLGSELRLVSDELKYGGTCDCYCMLNGKLTLLDFKTSKGVYDEMFTQVVAYAKLLEETDRKVEQIKILRIGRDEGEGFDDITLPDSKIPLHWERFLACLKIYQLNKLIKG